MDSKIFALLILSVYLTNEIEASSTPFTSCVTPRDPIEFRLVGCTETPCLLYRGESATAEWDFEVLADTDKLAPRVRAIMLGLSIPYDIGQENACDTLTNTECPLDVGEEITYALTMPVLSSYPLVSLTIEFALTDDNNNVQVCFRVPVRVADR